MTARPFIGLSWRAVALALALGAASPCLPPLARQAVAQTGEIALENLSFPVGPATYRIPRLRVLDTTLNRTELEALLSPASTLPLAERIAKLQAREIVAPEVIVEVAVGGGRQGSVYRDVVLTGLAGGRIQSIAAGGGTLAGTGTGGRPTTGSFGRLTARDVDLAHSVALFTDRAGPGPNLPKRVYGALAMQDFSVRTEDGVVSRLARLEAKDVSARLTAETWLGFMRLAEANPDLEKAPPAERRRVLGAFADLMDAFTFGSLEATGAEFTSPLPSPSTTKIARIALTGASAGRPNEFAVEGMEVAASDASVRLARFSLSEVSLAGSIDALRNLPQNGEELSAATLRKAIPTIGRIGLSGLDTTFPYGASPAGPGAPLRVSLAGIEITAAKPIEGVPTDTRLAMRNLAFSLPTLQGNEPMNELVRLGYDRLDLSLVLSALYDPAKQELTLRDFTLDSRDMGSFGLKALLGGVPPSVFDPDTAVASVALLGASARSLSIDVANGGLAERLLTLKARQLGRTTEDLRREYGMMAAIGVPAMLGSSPAAKAIGQAVAKFVAKPGRLVIDARSKGAAGFGIADFAAGPDPASVLEKLDVTARAD